MSVRGWIVTKLQDEDKDRYVISLEGEHGLLVERTSLPTARIYCIEPHESAPFGVEDLENALTEMPEVQFLVAIRRDVAHPTYEQAEQMGVCVDKFGELHHALRNDPDISVHRSREQKYLLRRVGRHISVSGIRRRGQAAYEITRTGSLRALTFVAIEHYELTSDEVYAILEDHDGLDVDVIVSTNPNARGFAQEVLVAAERAGVEVTTLGDFLDRLGDKWE